MRGLTKITKCKKPCHYKRYSFLGDQRVSSTGAGTGLVTFSVWAVSNDTMVEKEQLVYPFSSLVAEFGGTLSLFLGFSIMSLWDGGNFLLSALGTKFG